MPKMSAYAYGLEAAGPSLHVRFGAAAMYAAKGAASSSKLVERTASTDMSADFFKEETF
jgi:hypothetical protein